MKFSILLLALFTSVPAFAQNAIDCSQKSVQDSLFSTYSNRAHHFFLNDKRWVQTYDTLISICPNIAEAYQERALAYIESGDLEKLFQNLDKAVEANLNPN